MICLPKNPDGFTTEDIVFVWNNIDPLQITPRLHLPLFTLTQFETEYCTSKTRTGSYSCLEADLTLQRELSSYIRRVYLPAYLLVALSWAAFWLNSNKAQSVRFATQVVSLLGLLYLYSVQELPKISYTTKLDTFFIVSVLAVIVAFVLNVIIITFFNGDEDDEPKSRHCNKVECAARIVLPVIYTIYIVIYLVTL